MTSSSGRIPPVLRTQGLLLAATVAGPLLPGIPLRAAGLDAPVQEALSCRPVADLEPEASAGRPERIPSDLTPNGELLRWAAGVGETLRLRLFTAEGGTYTASLSAVHGPDGPVISAKLWDDPLTRKDETRIALQQDSSPEVLAIRFDPVSLSPGHHILEFSCLEAGDVLLDCIALRRTDPLVVPRVGDGAEGPPFLGVQMGRAGAEGVLITRIVPGSAAAESGLKAGDAIVRIDNERTDTADRVSEAILRHRPGDRVEVALLRDGKPLEMVVKLGRRSESNNGAQAANVLEVLEVRPGQVIADIGCGSGWLSEAIAKTLGDDGFVYAVEIQERQVRRLHRRSIPSVVPVLSLPHDVSLPAGSLDTAMLHDVASHVDQSARPRFYQSVVRALKPDGRLVIFGPHGGARSMLDELRGYGFVPRDDEVLGRLSASDLDERLQNGIVFRYRASDE